MLDCLGLSQSHQLHSCSQLNPAKLEKGTNVVENLQQLLKFLEEVTESIFRSAADCPR